MDYRTHLQDMKKSGFCPFCEEIKYAIDENNHAFVLPARAPYTPDHILICSKRHAETLADFSPQELADIYALITKWEILLHTKHGEIVVFLRQGSLLGTTGKSISHFHWHIVPHFTIKYGWTQESSDDRKVYTLEEYANIQQNLQQMM